MKKVGEKRYVVTVEEYEKEPHEIELENNRVRYGMIPYPNPPMGIIPGTIPPDDDDDEDDFIDDDWDDEDCEDDDDEEYDEIEEEQSDDMNSLLSDIEKIREFYSKKQEDRDNRMFDLLTKEFDEKFPREY